MFVVTVFVCNFFVLLVIFIFTLLLVIFVIFPSVVIGFGLAFAVFAVFVDIRNAPRRDRRCWLSGILNRYRDGSSRRE